MNENSEKISMRTGYYVSLVTAIITICTFAVALMTPPLSGPGCTGDCFEYPYSDIISRFPRDYYWMYPTMAISILFVFLMITVHYFSDSGHKIFSHAGFAISVISASILILNYYIQVSIIQPALLNGETEGIALITQYNPHGLFIALEEIGFFLMNLAFFVIIPVFANKGGVYKAIRLTYLTGSILALFSLIFVSIKLGIRREYILEIIIISIVWLELIISSILLSIVFRRKMKGIE